MKREEDLKEEELKEEEFSEEEEKEEEENVEEDEEKDEEDEEEDEEEEMTSEEYEDLAISILPGVYLGQMEIAGGAFSSFVYTSAEKNEDGSYSIYIVPDPDDDYTIEPQYYDLFEINEEEEIYVGKDKIQTWLKEHGFAENALDE